MKTKKLPLIGTTNCWCCGTDDTPTWVEQDWICNDCLAEMRLLQKEAVPA